MTKQEISSVNPNLLPTWAVDWCFPHGGSIFFKEIHLYKIRSLSHRSVFNNVDEVQTPLAWSDNMLRKGFMSNCLGIREGIMLIEDSRSLDPVFLGKHILLWRSSVRDTEGRFFVPFIQNIPGQAKGIRPIIYWHWFGDPLRATQATFLYYP